MNMSWESVLQIIALVGTSIVTPFATESLRDWTQRRRRKHERHSDFQHTTAIELQDKLVELGATAAPIQMKLHSLGVVETNLDPSLRNLALDVNRLMSRIDDKAIRDKVDLVKLTAVAITTPQFPADKETFEKESSCFVVYLNRAIDSLGELIRKT